MDISYVDEAKQALEKRNGLDSPDIEAHWFSTFEDEAGILAAHKHFAAAGLESNEDSEPMQYGGGLTVVWANTRPKAKGLLLYRRGLHLIIAEISDTKLLMLKLTGTTGRKVFANLPRKRQVQ